MENFIEIAAQNSKQAFDIIKKCRIVEIWQSINAKANLVGSLRMGLLMNHKDIDFHIYSEELNLQESFSAMSQLAANPSIEKIECRNLIYTEEQCIEWHAWYRDQFESLWQIDMIHILKGSAYDGYFEKIADEISAILTSETKNTILRLKYETPDNQKIMGIEYYQAVIQDGVKTFSEFEQWRKNHPVNGIVKWRPQK